MPEYAPLAPSAVADLGGGVVGGRRGEGDGGGGGTMGCGAVGGEAVEGCGLRRGGPRLQYATGPPHPPPSWGRLDSMARCANPATAPHGADAQLGQKAGSGLARGSRRQNMSVLRMFWALQVGCHGPWRDLEMW